MHHKTTILKIIAIVLTIITLFLIVNQNIFFTYKQQLIITILIIAIVTTLIDIIVTARENKKALNKLGAPYELIGKQGIVISDCSPKGKIKIHHAIWDAISINHDLLRTGDYVTVRKRKGLKLFVELDSEKDN